MEAAQAGPITVALVEDDDEARRRIVASIQSDPTLQLVGEYRNGAQALAGLAKSAPDVFLIDLGLPDIPGLEVVKRIAAVHPSCDVLVVTIFGDEESIIGALEAGARGYLLKGALEHDIAEDIRHLRNGGSPLSPVIARQVLKRLVTAKPAPIDDSLLTPRETEILNAIARGFSYAETAGLLQVSVQTVHTHLKNIYKKLAVHSKTEAVFEADRRRLL
ncbi:MAG TPA: response regulator transcription factor [Burkholderiales bacterium]|nr:response regulator transcription factor [Burkholderiales bacterium]